MRFIAWNMALAGWMLLSAFAFPHSEGSAALTGLMAVLVGTVALASPGLPGLRFVNALLVLALAAASLTMEGVGWPARVHNLLLCGAIFALSIIPGRSWGSVLVIGGDEPPPA